MRLSLILTATAAVFSYESSAAGGRRQVRTGGIARLGPGPASERGRRRPRNDNNPVIVPEELPAGVITGALERVPGAALPKPPRRRSVLRHPARPDISRIFVAGTGMKRT